MSTRPEVYEALDGERAYQDTRWNSDTTSSGGLHSFEEWFTYMEDYIAEAKHVLSRHVKKDADFVASHIMRKVTAMGVAAMEQLGAPKRDGF